MHEPHSIYLMQYIGYKDLCITRYERLTSAKTGEKSTEEKKIDTSETRKRVEEIADEVDNQRQR